MVKLERILLSAIAVIAFLAFALSAWIAFRPPEAALFASFAEVLGRKEATIIILQAQLQQLKEQIEQLKKPSGGK